MTGEENIQCKVCKKVLKSPEGLRQHEQAKKHFGTRRAVTSRNEPNLTEEKEKRIRFLKENRT